MNSNGLAPLVAALESRLDALGTALQQRDASQIDSHSRELQRTLASVVARLTADPVDAASLPRDLHERIAAAGERVARQRELLARSSSAVDRELAVLMPAPAPAAVYGQSGGAARPADGRYVAA